MIYMQLFQVVDELTSGVQKLAAELSTVRGASMPCHAVPPRDHGEDPRMLGFGVEYADKPVRFAYIP